MDFGWNIFDNGTAELVSNIINDGIEEINLNGFQFTNQGITTIAKITKFTNPVNIFTFYKNCDQYF